MSSFAGVVIVLFGFVCLCSGARFNGPITLSLFNPIAPQNSVNLILPNTDDTVVNDTTNWTPPLACYPFIGRLTWATPLNATMLDSNGVSHPEVQTFGVFYNSNGKLSGFVHRTLSNMTYGYANGATYWIHVPEGSQHPLFDFPAESWIHMIHLENTTNLCNGLGMPKNYVGAGDFALINNVPEFGATMRRYPFNKTDGRNLGFVHAPTGDACIPQMGCHWFDVNAGTPIYPQWVAGFDVYGDFQFTEVMTTSPQPIYRTQWELVPAGAIPEFGDVNWYFRHVHFKDHSSGCVSVCAQNKHDCAPTATCLPDFSQTPYFRCICPTNDTTIVTVNNGRGPGGCAPCPIGKIPSADRQLCVDACPSGYVADLVTGVCNDLKDCATAACASDETCLDLLGIPYACIYTQVASIETTWTTWIASQNTTDIANVLGSGVIILSYTVGKRTELIITLADPTIIVDADAAAAFSATAGISVTAAYDANQDLIVTPINAGKVNVIDSTDSAIALLASASSFALVALVLMF